MQGLHIGVMMLSSEYATGNVSKGENWDENRPFFKDHSLSQVAFMRKSKCVWLPTKYMDYLEPPLSLEKVSNIQGVNDSAFHKIFNSSTLCLNLNSSPVLGTEHITHIAI